MGSSHHPWNLCCPPSWGGRSHQGLLTKSLTVGNPSSRATAPLSRWHLYCALPCCRLGFSVPFFLPPCQHYILQYQNYTMKQALSNFNHYKCPSLRNTIPCLREKKQLTMPRTRAYNLLKTSFLSTGPSLALDVAWPITRQLKAEEEK